MLTSQDMGIVLHTATSSYRGSAASLNQGQRSTPHGPESSNRKEEFVEENFIALLSFGVNKYFIALLPFQHC